MELKEYCRFHFKLKSKLADLKKRFVRNMHLIFPEYDQVFSTVFTKTSIAILKKYQDLRICLKGEKKNSLN